MPKNAGDKKLRKMDRLSLIALLIAGIRILPLEILAARSNPFVADTAVVLTDRAEPILAYYHTIPAYLNHIHDLFLRKAPTDEKKSASPAGPPAPGENPSP
jgi:hypothetical protein